MSKQNTFILCVAIFAVVVLLVRYLKPKIKGFLGEMIIRFRLLFLNKKEYKIIHNVHVFYNGMMSQIDHIIVSCYGIFVLETKNYKGWIFGSEKAYEWTQVIFNNRYKLYNPLRQNLGHVKALKANLSEYTTVDYFPIVVFIGSARLKINSTFPVIKHTKLLKTIKGTKDININEEIRDEIYNHILQINGNKPLVLPKKFETQPAILEEKNVCEYCNSELRLREGKFSKFWGCTNYPSCNYTKRIR